MNSFASNTNVLPHHALSVVPHTASAVVDATAEALKSWTILLIIIGCVGLGFALLFSRVLPLV